LISTNTASNLAYRQGKGEQVRYFFQNQARLSNGTKRIVFAEGEEPKVIRAAAQITDEKIGVPILIGRPDVIQQAIEELGLVYSPELSTHLISRGTSSIHRHIMSYVSEMGSRLQLRASVCVMSISWDPSWSRWVMRMHLYLA
jgi:phosphotransacetylase